MATKHFSYVSGVAPSSLCDRRVVRYVDWTGSIKLPLQVVRSRKTYTQNKQKTRFRLVAEQVAQDVADVLVVGSGIGGLCCAALCAKFGYKVVVFESHSEAGGAAHSWRRGRFSFDSGPSLFSGLSAPSPNPLRQVLDLIGESPRWIAYKSWGVHLPEGSFETGVGIDGFDSMVGSISGTKGLKEWRELQGFMKPLSDLSVAFPPAAMRTDFKVLGMLARYLPTLFSYGFGLRNLPLLVGPFSKVLDAAGTKDIFIRRWLDLLCFLLSGLPADGTIGVEMAFMFNDFYREDCVLDWPEGGSGALVDALVRGIVKFGGKVQLNSHVEAVLVENGRAAGVRLRNGSIFKAKTAVVSNASIWDTVKLMPGLEQTPLFVKADATPQLPSFIHLHLAFRGAGLPTDLPCHHLVLNDWTKGVTAPQNVVLISIPSIIDSTLAPEGFHVLHAYVPATEPYDIYEGLSRDEYLKLKEERAEVLWRAIEKVIPDIKDRVELSLVGSPLTHQFFLRRSQGTYGPAIKAGEGVFPGPNVLPVQGLLCVGDSVFPGIGMPAVAASGMIAAHSLIDFDAHISNLDELQR